MPKSKNAPKTSKVNKSAWVRSQPNSMPAKDVVAKAKGEGISLSIAQVYTTRSNAKSAKRKSGGKSKGGRPKGSKSVTATVSGDLNAIRRAVFEHGFSRVEAFLTDLKKSVGL